VSEAQDFAREADALLERITLLFAGKTLELVRAVINDLTAQWICRHCDGMRDELLDLHVQHVWGLVAMYLGDADG
jgi:hypothetical protein